MRFAQENSFAPLKRFFPPFLFSTNIRQVGRIAKK